MRAYGVQRPCVRCSMTRRSRAKHIEVDAHVFACSRAGHTHFEGMMWTMARFIYVLSCLHRGPKCLHATVAWFSSLANNIGCTAPYGHTGGTRLGRKILDLRGLWGPRRPGNPSKRWGASPPPFPLVSRPPGAAQTPKIQDFPSQSGPFAWHFALRYCLCCTSPLH